MKDILMSSLMTSNIDATLESDVNYQNRLLDNSQEKVVSSIRRLLRECDEFIISVAFITEGGVTLILEELKVLEDRGVKGRILTGDYLSFTEPKALKRLMNLKNIDIRMLKGASHHAKGYFFRKGEIWNLVIGSSNLTASALTTNYEWNLKVSSHSSGKIAKDVIGAFLSSYGSLETLCEMDIKEYERIYRGNHSKKTVEKRVVTPNKMQKEALISLERMKKEVDKALLISATGTGKTYLSAFDVMASKPKKLLFIAHRKTILEKARDTYRELLKDKKVAIYKGNIDKETDFTFGMIQTLSKDEHLLKFSKDYFDYIIVDEVHHSGALSYQKVLNYFKPKFMLGMTATPERTDTFDIYELFDHNIAYDIRLYEALEQDLLCPFHYFGVSDVVIEGMEVDEKTSIKNLVIDERVEHIIEKSKYYGYSGDTLHGLIFTSKVEEAKIIASKLSMRGYPSIALSSEDSDSSREKAISELEDGKLSYIISVDIFNEGVDIPCINQVILLRPTESSIVYIQQLGRGLRKNKNKEYVVILDFIGNYEKSFLVPTALSSDMTYDRDYLKRFLLNGSNLIPGESTVSFQDIVREKIFEKIDSTNFSTKKNIKHDFDLLEKQLGRIPLLYDFYSREMIDPSVILKYKKDYDEVVVAMKGRDSSRELSKEEKDHLRYLSNFFTPAKRVHEMVVLETALEYEEIEYKDIMKKLSEMGLEDQEMTSINAIRHLSKEIFTSLSTMKQYLPILEKKGEKYQLINSFKRGYSENIYFKELIDDLIKYNKAYTKKHYYQKDSESIIKYNHYTKQEAFWYMNLDFNNGYQVSGYTPFENERKLMIFIVLDGNGRYTNDFFDARTFKWYSKNNRYLSKNGRRSIEGKIADEEYEIEVFIKKKLGEAFYYVGNVSKVLEAVEKRSNKGISFVEYTFKLKSEINSQLLEYFNL